MNVNCVVLCMLIMLFYVLLIVLFYVWFVSIASFYVLFVCKCVLYYCLNNQKISQNTTYNISYALQRHVSTGRSRHQAIFKTIFKVYKVTLCAHLGPQRAYKCVYTLVTSLGSQMCTVTLYILPPINPTPRPNFGVL